MVVRIYEPPTAVNLFDAEKARRFRLRAFVSAVLVEFEMTWFERRAFVGPGFLQIIERTRFATPVRVNPLAEFVHDHFGIEHRIAGILFSEADGADFEDGFADG